MTEGLVFIPTCDLVALTRGRAMRAADYARRRATGVGWVPADLALTTFGDIASPNVFGSLGDLRLLPDEATHCVLPASGGRPATDLVLASIHHPDGRPWECCPRHALAAAVADLERHGIRLLVAFEQEFRLTGTSGGAPFGLDAMRAAEPFGSAVMEALADAGLEPETWLPEYGVGQFEVTVGPADPLRAADRAILVREIVRDLATAHGLRATFAPLVDPAGVGSGVHVHLSLWGADERPLTVDRDTLDLTPEAGRFAAGILAHAPALVGWTAPSVVSSIRLTPHRWSSAAAYVGRQDREALLRICPVLTLGDGDPLRSANLEYRAADATANPWLVLAALIRAGLHGLDAGMATPPVVDDLEALSAADRDRLGVRSLPADLPTALAAIEADADARAWFHPDLVATHLSVRRTELAILDGATEIERCQRYADVL